MIESRHTERMGLEATMHAIRVFHKFDERGICQDLGKYEGCYEATIYFHQVGLDGDNGEGLVSYPDGSSKCAYKVTSLERAHMAGPWDLEGNIFNLQPDLLFVVHETAGGGVISSHQSEEQWRFDRDEAEEDIGEE